ncbi:UNVERIFIED_CONTAM: Inactive protein kinase SELMODRAFT [Sesamum radiatum]|uniref:Inactive protein kinase SELMODRAFT n=1 Tax=Sesamum radiatum TaxID=300843 RepID=A0AAW2WHV5_SESRA
MSRDLKKVGKQEKGCDVAGKVVVAVKASKDIPKTALVWALTHVVQPGDCITLLVVISSHTSGRKWGFPRFAGDCASGHRRSHTGTSAEQKSDITDSCSQMILQLHDVYDPNKINVKIKIVSGTPCGAVASEAKKNQANWVVLDKQLKQEEKRCMEELQCNIVVMKRSQPKVLRLNLVGSPREEAEVVSSEDKQSSEKQENRKDTSNPTRGPLVTPSSSPETFTATEAGTSSVSSSDPGTSPFFTTDTKDGLKTEKLLLAANQERDHDESSSDTESESLSSSSSLRFQPWMAEIANFLAEGGFGSVHRGVLPDGQTIAVKQHKLASSQGDQEFCSEVEVLSCAQHRNVVMLIGFCIEDGRRLLVYEYICNGSLDSHLYELVGCIVHRDMRPNNILITHDFEPLVGDFGLARWQPDGEKGVETRVIGTFGYLAPEYAQSGQITEKADVYSFGVVLVELVTGRKAVDLNRPKGQQCLTEWARPLLEAYAIDELVDPQLGSNYSENEVYCMLHAASLCICRDPQARPRMSQVLRILEGDAMDSSQLLGPGFDAGSRSGRIWLDHQLQHEQHSGPLVNESSGRFSSKLSLNSRQNFRETEKAKI